MMKSVVMVIMVAMVAFAAVPGSEAAVPGCGTVVSYVSRCLPYVTNKGPLGACCGGVKGLYSIATTTQDRRTVCTCLKAIASSNSGVDFKKAGALPGLCGVSIPYKISPSTDCSKVT